MGVLVLESYIYTYIRMQGQWNIFITGPTKLDHEDYAIKCVGG